MTSSSTVVPLRQPDEIDDPLTAVLRAGARRLLAQAIEAEADAFLALMKGERLPDGRERVVRHGHGPERQVQTGIGPVAVQRAKLRDRGASDAGERIRFRSAILPRWARRTRSLMRCCRFSICAGSRCPANLLVRRATSRRRSGRCSARTPRTCRHRWSHGCGASGRRTTRAGNGATCRPDAMCMSGPTAFTCRRAWSRRPSACWC